MKSSTPIILRRTALIIALSAAFPAIANDNNNDQDAQKAKAERVIIKGDKPTTLPTEIPTTIEGINAKAIETTINALDAEDALKYLPSLLVRKRYDGDYNHAVLATRASGTGNSARSMVYADGILLSNLLGNGAALHHAGAWSHQKKFSALTCYTAHSPPHTQATLLARWLTTSLACQRNLKATSNLLASLKTSKK